MSCDAGERVQVVSSPLRSRVDGPDGATMTLLQGLRVRVFCRRSAGVEHL